MEATAVVPEGRISPEDAVSIPHSNEVDLVKSYPSGDLDRQSNRTATKDRRFFSCPRNQDWHPTESRWQKSFSSCPLGSKQSRIEGTIHGVTR